MYAQAVHACAACRSAPEQPWKSFDLRHGFRSPDGQFSELDPYARFALAVLTVPACCVALHRARRLRTRSKIRIGAVSSHGQHKSAPNAWTRASSSAGREISRGRRLLCSIAGTYGLKLPDPAHAAIVGSAREAISDFTTSLGGAPGDIYYPSWLLGDWDTTSELVSVDLPQGEANANPDILTIQASVGTAAAVSRYPLRFVSYRGKVICDRAFSVKAWLQNSNGVDRVGVVESTEWDPTNANVLSATFRRGDGLSVTREFYVRNRSIGIPEGRDDLFNASERYQEVVMDARSGTPLSVFPRRRVTKFKRVVEQGRTVVQLLQRIELFPALVTPDGAGAVPMGDADKPVAVYKYRVILTPSVSSSSS